MAGKIYTCAIQGDRRVSGECLHERDLVKIDQFREICSIKCHYFRDEFPKEKTRAAVPAKIRKPRKLLKRWVDDYWAGIFQFRASKRKEAFYHGSLSEIRKILRIKNPGTIFEDQLRSCAWKFVELILFEIQTLPEKKKIARTAKKIRPALASIRGVPSYEDNLKEYYDRLEKESTLLQRERINRPLYCYVSALAIFYEKWTGKTVTRSNAQFKEFVDYCIDAMGLSPVWPEGSTKKVIERMIAIWLSPLRNSLSINSPSIPLKDIDPTEIIPSIYLLDSVSTMPLPDKLAR